MRLDGTTPERSVTSRRRWRRILQKLRWAVIATIFPDYVLYEALRQLRAAREISKFKNRIVTENAEQERHPACPIITSDQTNEEWTAEHGFFAIMGGVAILGLLPDISFKAIRKKSRSSLLAKGIVCGQVSWMLVQVIARKASGLPVTLLELNTIAHVGCAIAIYGIWWYKPQDVSEQVIMDTTECTTCDDLLRTRGVFKSGVAVEVAFDDSGVSGFSQEFFLCFVSLAYAGIHAAAWNAHFPSVVEENFWRASVCTVIFGSIWITSFIYLERGRSGITIKIVHLRAFLVFGSYVIARMFLIVEAFISVRALPIGAYDTVQWSNAFPHIG